MTKHDRFWAAKQLAVEARGGGSDGWAAKRVVNLHRMLAKAKKDDAALFEGAMRMLDALSRLLTGVGDEAGSLYAASLARLLERKRGWLPQTGPQGPTDTHEGTHEGRAHRRKKS
jgi:hypothetical protein